MWESPIYKFNQEAGLDPDGKRVYKQVVIDVTRSAPSFAGPGKALSGALDEAVAVTGIGPRDTILDFGAGKLRNTIYLLEKGYRVCAVEFADQFDRSKPARENLARAEDEFRRRFSRLVFPEAFEASQDRYKLILLINVINIMPVLAERNYVLALCNERLAEGGRLLWYTQRGDENYRKQRLKKEYQLEDGVYVGRTTYAKTFYREYDVQEIDDLLGIAGFDYDRKIEATWRNQSRLYKKTGSAVLADVLDPETIDRAQVSDDSIPDPSTLKAKRKEKKEKDEKLDPRRFEPPEVAVEGEKRKGQANPAKLSTEAGLIERLKKVKEGDDGQAETYLELIERTFEHLFADALHKYDRVTVPAGSKFKDLMAYNKSKDGFFASLRPSYDLISRRVVVRCRNHRHTKAGAAFGGLADGMNHNLGFAFLAYRGGRRKHVFERCRRQFRVSDPPTAILPLDDHDFAALLNGKQKAASSGKAHRSRALDRYLEDRLREVTAPLKVFLSYSRKDTRQMEELEEHLAPLVQRRAIDLFIDREKIRGGDPWKGKIAAAVAEAEVAIFLLSPSFLASKFIGPHEADPLLRRQGVRILQVLLRDVVVPARFTKKNFVGPVQPLHGRPRDPIWKQLVLEVQREF